VHRARVTENVWEAVNSLSHRGEGRACSEQMRQRFDTAFVRVRKEFEGRDSQVGFEWAGNPKLVGTFK